MPAAFFISSFTIVVRREGGWQDRLPSIPFGSARGRFPAAGVAFAFLASLALCVRLLVGRLEARPLLSFFWMCVFGESFPSPRRKEPTEGQLLSGLLVGEKKENARDACGAFPLSLHNNDIGISIVWPPTLL